MTCLVVSSPSTRPAIAAMSGTSKVPLIMTPSPTYREPGLMLSAIFCPFKAICKNGLILQNYWKVNQLLSH